MRDDLARVEPAVLDEPAAGVQSTADGARNVDAGPRGFERRWVEHRRAAPVVSKRDAEAIERSVRNIPIGAQTVLENFNNIPTRGDIFHTKEDLWPVVRAADRGDLDQDTAPAEAGAWI